MKKILYIISASLCIFFTACGNDSSIANLGVHMELGKIVCSRSKLNNQCIEERCPFHVKN